MKTLQEIFNEIGNLTDIDFGGNDKGGKIHTYLETYDKLFAPYRNNCSFLEIGLAMGDSMKLFNRYFQNSNIVGIDISVVFDWVEDTENNNSVQIIQHDATKPTVLSTLDEQMFDIVIDDGSHMTNDQIKTFHLLKERMNKGSIYIIEDILALDLERHKYLALHKNVEIIDMRSNGRFDNVLIVIRFD